MESESEFNFGEDIYENYLEYIYSCSNESISYNSCKTNF